MILYVYGMKTLRTISFTVVSSLPELSLRAAHEVERICNIAVVERGCFTLSLSGGSTPNTLFDLLASPEWRGRLCWDKTAVYWGDERCVTPDDESSNYWQAHSRLLSHVNAAEIFRIKGEKIPQAAATDYENQLLKSRSLWKNNTPGNVSCPRFDCILLGMGSDGHTASIFPGENAINEFQRIVVEQYISKLNSWRVTLTLPVLNNARNCLFLVSGKEKAHALREIFENPTNPLPAGQIRPRHGTVHWMVDQEAASFLSYHNV